MPGNHEESEATTDATDGADKQAGDEEDSGDGMLGEAESGDAGAIVVSDEEDPDNSLKAEAENTPKPQAGQKRTAAKASISTPAKTAPPSKKAKGIAKSLLILR